MEAGKQPLERGTGLALFAMAAAVLVMLLSLAVESDLTTTIFTESGEDATGGEAFVESFDTAFRVDALIALGGFAIAVLYVGGSPRHRRRAAA